MSDPVPDPVPDRPTERLAEVYGDLVDLRHLAIAVVIGTTTALPSFLLAWWAFSTFVQPAQLAKTYALLVGLAACLGAGVVCARLFPPKRIVREDAAADAEAQRALIAELAAQPGGLGRVADLPEETRREMRELGLLDLFVEHEQRSATASEAGR